MRNGSACGRLNSGKKWVLSHESEQLLFLLVEIFCLGNGGEDANHAYAYWL